MRIRAILIVAAILLAITAISIVGLQSEENSMDMTVYNFNAKMNDGSEKELADYKGKIILIVNVASKCGFTPQYEGLEALYKNNKEKGFEILAFPCNQFGAQEPGTAEEIKEFCSTNYGISFPLFDKIDVNGDNQHPLYKWLKSSKTGLITSDIKWNFTKFLINRNGEVIERYAPQSSPESIQKDIDKLL